MSAPSSSIVELASNLEIESGGTLSTDSAEFLTAGSGTLVSAEPNGTVSMSGGLMQGGVRGECPVGQLGGATLTITGVAFAGGRIDLCNIHMSKGPRGSALGNSGVGYYANHEHTCVWTAGPPVPTPSTYSRTVWDVFMGALDDPPCLPGFTDIGP
jgi:hypothetical protein